MSGFPLTLIVPRVQITLDYHKLPVSSFPAAPNLLTSAYFHVAKSLIQAQIMRTLSYITSEAIIKTPVPPRELLHVRFIYDYISNRTWCSSSGPTQPTTKSVDPVTSLNEIDSISSRPKTFLLRK